MIPRSTLLLRTTVALPIIDDSSTCRHRLGSSAEAIAAAAVAAAVAVVVVAAAAAAAAAVRYACFDPLEMIGTCLPFLIVQIY